MKQLLLDLGACAEALRWASDKTWNEIFETCYRGDWLLWLFKRTNPDDLKELTRAKAHCALTVRHLMKDQRSINACEVALKFADGLATRDELNAAANAAYAAAAAAAAYAAANAAYAAYAAAYAAYAAAYAAYAAAYDDSAAAAAAAYAAYAAAYDDSAAAAYAAANAANAYAAKIKNRLETADACRKYLPIEIWNIK